jgi:hypothetical protein
VVRIPLGSIVAAEVLPRIDLPARREEKQALRCQGNGP